MVEPILKAMQFKDERIAQLEDKLRILITMGD